MQPDKITAQTSLRNNQVYSTPLWHITSFTKTGYCWPFIMDRVKFSTFLLLCPPSVPQKINKIANKLPGYHTRWHSNMQGWIRAHFYGDYQHTCNMSVTNYTVRLEALSVCTSFKEISVTPRIKHTSDQEHIKGTWSDFSFSVMC